MSFPAFVYARYSALEQGRGTSLVRQFENGRNYALSKGWLIDPEREISDKGKSAFHGANRSDGGALYAFERQVERGFYRNGAVFVVEHFDRISRQGWEEVHAFLKLCTENGVSVATIDGDRFYEAGKRIDGGTIMELVFKSEGARDESDKKSKRGLDNWSRKVASIQNGDRKVNIGLLPAWLRRDPKTGEAALDNHRAKVLREIFDLYVEGFGLPGIVRLLNGRGEPSWAFGRRDAGKGWNTAYVHKLLTNRAVLGEFHPMSRAHGGMVETSKGVVVPDFYPQAIPAELFKRVEHVRTSRRGMGGPGEARVSNLFSGCIVCDHCGAPMYLQSQQRQGRPTNHKSKVDGRKLTYVAGVDRSYLLCNNNRRQHQCDNRSRFRYEHLEPAILDAVLDLVIEDRSFSVSDRVAGLSATIAERERQIDGKRLNLDAIVESLAEHFIKALGAKAAELEAEIDQEEEELAELEAELRRETGTGSPSEQLARVREVRASVTSEDEDARYSARVRVKLALGQLIQVRCDRSGIATVILTGGLMAWRFGTQGELLGMVDLRQRLDLHRGLTSGELANNAQAVEAVKRRSAAKAGVRETPNI